MEIKSGLTIARIEDGDRLTTLRQFTDGANGMTPSGKSYVVRTRWPEPDRFRTNKYRSLKKNCGDDFSAALATLASFAGATNREEVNA